MVLAVRCLRLENCGVCLAVFLHIYRFLSVLCFCMFLHVPFSRAVVFGPGPGADVRTQDPSVTSLAANIVFSRR